MKISMSGTLIALSTALDYVESEVFGVTTHHSKRVAYLCARMGAELGYSPKELSALAGAAVMHDNALTEYIAARRAMDNSFVFDNAELGPHCKMGERNMRCLPFYESVKGAVLYHHENADGSGPFHKLAAETPQFAQLIHVADQVDNAFHLDDVSERKYEEALKWLEANSGMLFDGSLFDLFRHAVPYPELKKIEGNAVLPLLEEVLPDYSPEYDSHTIISFATVFARITDYKSHFTSTHSLGIAEKSAAMGRFFGEDTDTCTKLYLAGALHDIGKLTIPNEILEKPDKLTDEEFAVMKTHARASYEILKNLTDIPDVISWACLHHEKLDGSGYPFGKTAAELNRNERLLCCIDIYQALTEARPYKKGLSHDKSIAIMQGMAQDGKIDAGITEDIAAYFKG
ncbi:hypothetical protein OBV_01170 [Oscillibacter valericigenes Sjm18-20]|nr:hypothetical protein OBV_01170 [Oscillibacter valericigenes Sjm18-20]